MRSDSTASPGPARERGAGLDPLITRREVAQWAGTRRETVTVWQSRHADFPRPEADGETERFRLSEMLAWLAGRPVPAAQRLAGEPDGVTYADRVRRATGLPHGMASGSGASAGADTSRSAEMSRSAGTGNGPGSAGGAGMRPGPRVDDTLVKEILTELFGPLGRRIRGGASGAAYLHLVVGLLFLRHRSPPSWAGLRDEVRTAVDEQSDPRLLMGAIGRRVDAVRLDQQRRPATETAVATFSALGGRAAGPSCSCRTSRPHLTIRGRNSSGNG